MLYAGVMRGALVGLCLRCQEPNSSSKLFQQRNRAVKAILCGTHRVPNCHALPSEFGTEPNDDKFKSNLS
eukprot:2642134-Amphidinium_carterae.1